MPVVGMSGLDGRSARRDAVGSGRKETNPKGGSVTKKRSKIQQSIEYCRQCQLTHNTLVQSMRQWRLIFVVAYTILELLGKSVWGYGNILPNVFLLHRICLKLRRFCYVKVFDMELHRHMRYASGQSWGPLDPSEISQYTPAET